MKSEEKEQSTRMRQEAEDRKGENAAERVRNMDSRGREGQGHRRDKVEGDRRGQRAKKQRSTSIRGAT